MLSTLYAAAARRRRERFAARPDLRRRLRRPVLSIGNLAVGGRGKTPFTALVARELLAMGERPAILSRGYRRTDPVDGAVIVRDAGGIRADLARSGDEPLMLARQLPGSVIITASDRFLAGRLAERHLGATVHLLDDGFQHLQLDRDADIVLIARDDLDARTLPSGRLREPADVLVAADAIVALDALDPTDRPAAPEVFFTARRQTGLPQFAGERPIRTRFKAFLVSGIATPSAFKTSMRSADLHLVGERIFRDHHPYSARDVRQILADAGAAGAEAILTTEKDFVRLLPHRPFSLPLGYVPLTMEVEPLAEFRAWLRASLADARDQVLA